MSSSYQPPTWLSALFGVHLLSAAAFMFVVEKPVFDEPQNLPDARRYAEEGLTTDTVRRHINAPAPGSFYLMALGARVFGDHLWAYRLPIWFSWVILGWFLFRFDRRPEWAALAGTALIGAIVPPHASVTTATLMTEGPAQLFGIMAAFIFVRALSEPEIGEARRSSLILLSGLCAGLAIACRQYYLALLPAMGLFALVRRTQRSPRFWLAFASACIIALVPIAMVVQVWGGLSSPGVANGTSYVGHEGYVGINLGRPLIAAFYVSVYLLPLSVGGIVGGRPADSRFPPLAFAVIAALSAGIAGDALLQPGPMRTVMESIFTGQPLRSVSVGLVAGIAAYNAVELLRNPSESAIASPMALFSWLLIAFYIAEQAGMAGTIPFYERYVSFALPFAAIVTVGRADRIGRVRTFVVLMMFAVGTAVLWRYS